MPAATMPEVHPAASSSPALQSSSVVTITILHTNDFHGQLEPSGSNPGMARVAYVIKQIRAEVGDANVVLLDAGDIMQGSLLSNLFHGKSTINVYNAVGYDAATLGNHEFDWGQTVLISRTQEAQFPFVAANLVVSDTGSCATAGWTVPSFVRPWITMTVGTPPNQVILGIIGVTTQETPYITVAWATQGLCFKDPVESILHYYDEVKAAGANTIVVLSHLGYTDGGYGYGFPVYGDQTLARRLVEAGKPVPLIIGGHTHTDLTSATNVSGTLVVQAHYNGRKVGRATLVVNKDTGAVTVSWQRIVVSTTDPEDSEIKNLITQWANDTWYQEQINRVVGYTNVDIVRNYNGDSLMGAFVNDAIYNDLNNDSTPDNDVDMVFNNPGGLRADILTGGITPYTITHGMLFNVLPFGNQTVVGNMTGAQIMELLNQSATLFKGAIQVSGIRYSFYNYTDTLPGPQPWAWGAITATVRNRSTSEWEPLDLARTYRVATNEFLAPAGQDGFLAFKYMTNLSYWGDMLDGVERWVSSVYTISNPYNGTLDGRITRLGTAAGGPVIPVTILHHNDSHGRLNKTAYAGYTQLATLINQQRAHNPNRTILLNAGDQIQGDAMMYYFKTAPKGYAADGTPLPITMTVHPMIAVMNAMTYTAMTLGNHEFNFGNDVFTSVLRQADFPILQANIYDDGRYGLDKVPVEPYTVVRLPAGTGAQGVNTIDVAILGIGNHRVPRYELPSNIVGLTFTDPITEAQKWAPWLKSRYDAVVALTHIGFTTISGSVEVDDRVDTVLAAQTPGVDAVIGGHSHTDPSKQTLYSGDYKYLPAIIPGPNNTPVIVNQAYRYNTYLGQVVLGLLPDGTGGYQVVSRAGRYIAVDSTTPEDTRIKSIVDPYVNFLNDYTGRAIGQTTVPLDALPAYTQETNAANLQADASVWELAQHGINVDFHLSGAMTNQKVAASATPTNPVTLTVSNMFTLMPYENSLVVMRMNGPQLKRILERAYRNYYYYKYVPNAGGYSYYTTCMLDISSGGQITYRDTYPLLPNGNNVASLTINGREVDFLDATTYYTVSTVNYLAAGSCNFSDAGQTLWPLDQIVYDTQYYVRDAVINYIQAQGTISPTVEGRLQFLYLNQRVFLPLVLKGQ
jgi:2',3'-cyclic-nucleotide 2'-phosphodiesterase (5'-nucleotidase family)